MKIMNNKRILWLAALLLTAGSAADSYAQSGVQYPYTTSAGSTSGKTSVIVSRDAAGGVKAACIHANWKASTLPVHYEQETENNAVSARFEVASADLAGTMSWNNARTGCAAYKQSGTSAGDWRLPTQRELMLIWVMQKKGLLTGLTFPGNFYWTSTTWSECGSIWYMDFKRGATQVSSTDIYNVRCVRDF